MRLLLVEDTADLAQSVLRFLTAAGHAVDHAPDAATAAEAVALTEYACVVLDLGLPDGSGWISCANGAGRTCGYRF